jgi:uncharacterized protein
MSKIGKVNEYINAILARTSESLISYIGAYSHMQQVSHICSLLAVKRGENAELAAIAGLLHDIAYINCYDNEMYKPRDSNNKILEVNKVTHSDVSAVIAMEILTENNIVSHEESDIICRAIIRHNKGNLDNADNPIDDILKDADVFAHGLTSVSELINNFRGQRWDKVCHELGVNNCREKNNDEL